MMVVPAIDLKEGRCVRLRQGEMSRVTIYSEEPAEVALIWCRKGAERIHVVDLDGAAQGRPANEDAIRRIVGAVSVPVQLGGGIREVKTVEKYFELGVSAVILGTAAIKSPDLVSLACRLFPGRIILAIDAKQDCVAIEGWTESIPCTPLEMAKRFEQEGVWAVIYTDILRDGMRTGPNLNATRELAKRTTLPIFASGGISNIEDVIRITGLIGTGVIGMITGRALYEGSLDLAEAIRAARGKKV